MFRLLPWSSGVGGNKVTTTATTTSATTTTTAAEEDAMNKILAVSPSHQHQHHHLQQPQSRSPGGVMERQHPQQQHVAAAAPSPASPKRKRKRAGSGESGSTGAGQERPPAKSPRPENKENAGVNGQVAANTYPGEVAGEGKQSAEKPSERSHGSTSPVNNTSTGARPSVTPQQSQTPWQPKDPEAMRQSIEAQLSLEVLLKHDELRLIDQEIAKCQIALEQLRRCSEIPYPGSDAAGVVDSASMGAGRAVVPPGNGRPPTSPTPWGVRDGPYGRHYAKWLIPDPRFDGGSVEANGGTSAAATASIGAGKAPIDGRATRGSVGDAGAAGANQRPQRGAAGSNLQSLSNGYPPPKDKTGPTIIKRKTDGHLVKLVCLDCRRDNFFSTQGFINHCRIAHNRNFASHDAAAIASGEEVEVDEAGMVVGENNKDSGAAPGYIHPLIRSAHLVDAPKKASVTRRKSSKRGSQAGSQPSSEAQPETKPAPTSNDSSASATPKVNHNPSPNPEFKASPETPHLSALMQRRGFGLDLLNIVGDAKTKSELDMLDSPTGEEGESSEDESEKKNALATGEIRGSRQPARTVASSTQMQRPNSRKGLDSPARKPRYLDSLAPSAPPKAYTSPYAPAPAPQQPDNATDITSANLSPNTVESNQAPSLVSDDGDYEMPSDSEGPSPSSSDEEADDRRFDNIEVEDDEDRRGGPAAAEGKGGGKGDLVTRRSGVPLRYPRR